MPQLAPATRSRYHELPTFPRAVYCTAITLTFFFATLGGAEPNHLGLDASIGLPISRNYSIEEIGAARGPNLNFDRLGRVAVISGGSYLVLNDNNWIDLAVHDEDILPVLELVVDEQGNAYYGALASWGIAETTQDGRILPVSLRPEEYPTWVNSTNFTQIVFTKSGVLFAGTNGLVHLDTNTKEQTFIEKQVANVFTLDSEVYVSAGPYGTARLDPLKGEFETIDSGVAVYESAVFGLNGIVGATSDNRLVHFDGERFSERDFGFGTGPLGAISCLEALPEGGFAISFDSDGLYIVSNEGKPQMALTTTDYRRIYDLAVHDPGILWLSRESSVEKLLYNNPVSVVDQRSEVVIGWPQVVQRSGDSLIASNGRLYQMNPAEGGWHHEFHEIEDLPTGGAWAIAANQDHLLIGNSNGVYSLRGDSFESALANFDANRLFLQDRDLCVVVGSREIAAIRWDGNSWSECAPRIEGVGFPSIAHRTDTALWIELGLDRVARVWFEAGKLNYEIINQFPWDEPVWVNIGILEEYVVLSGAHNQRVYLDKTTAKRIQEPSIEKALSQAPETILRVSEDSNGIIWATHPTGVYTFHPTSQGYRIDSDSLASIHDQYPVITLSSGKHAWISTESALYHVNQDFEPRQPSRQQPFLVSIANGKTGEQLFSATRGTPPIDKLPYSQNHLVFRYFSGGYGPLQAPVYEFFMHHGSDSWRVESEESLLTLPSLEEGNYRLTARLLEGASTVGEPIVTTFVIEPPWYRSTFAYVSYWSSGLFLCFAVIGLGHTRAKRKHNYLEKLVNERTEELRATMDKLTEEARTSATLAERNRLAGEIHDSLQQGLSGLAFQLDTTARLDNIDPKIKSRIQVARKMVTFTRQEVQQAVWDLESPLLENDDLTQALKNMAGLLNTSPSKIVIECDGPSPSIQSRVKHHVLRIAQETITNAIRHSKADTINVRLYQRDNKVFLEVSDDGIGFDQEKVLATGLRQFGLRGLKTRALKIGGDLVIESKVTVGTTVKLIIPASESQLESNVENDGQQDKDTPS